VIAKSDGTFVPREKRPREEPTETVTRKERLPQTPSETSAAASAPKQKLLVNNVPHKTLFAQNVPDECNDRMLSMLFQPFPGFEGVRMVPGKKGIAFIDFQDVIQAGIALQQLNGFQLTATETLHLTYAKQ
jgi:U2 small nuclear ribonucleoprotein B''